MRGQSVSAQEIKKRQRLKIKEIGEALTKIGGLDHKAEVLGLSRTTTWTIVRAQHKNSGLSASIINRILATPWLPLSIRTTVEEYVKEKLAGLYGHTTLALRHFRRALESPTANSGVTAMNAKGSKDKTRYPNSTHRNPVQLELRKYFGDLEIVDAKIPLQLFPNEDDFRKATQLDPFSCGFKRAAERQCGATAAVVFEGSAYFDYAGTDGVRRIYRHIPAPPTKEVIRTFDQEGPDAVDIKRAFIFAAPAKSKSREYIAKSSRKIRRGPSRVFIDAHTLGRKLNKAREKLRKTEADLDHQKERFDRVAAQRSPKAPMVLETQKQIERLKKERREQLARVTELRLEAMEKKTKADAIRQRPFRRRRINPKVHNLHVRNGAAVMNALMAERRTQEKAP